jgi:CDGSH-type Zn-finger protein/uncharacterized Fe-S cluster protein YjdI
MEEDVHRYHGTNVEVSFDSERCIHARECVEGLPAVFDTGRRPWVDPDGADAEELAAVIERCPTGALRYERRDGGPAESPPPRNTVTVVEDGPLYLRGDVAVRSADGETLLADSRVALCRCGHSGNKPLCDNSHDRVFEAAGLAPEAAAVVEDEGDTDGGSGRLTVTLTPDGPFRLDGRFTLREVDAVGERDGGDALCRCGASASKPFCDGSHAAVDFSTAGEE